MVLIETQIREAGVTIVMNGKTAAPLERGVACIGDDMEMYFEYYESGQFLRNLAERVIQAQQLYALDGFRMGGKPPYGFVRVLVDSSGQILEELTPGRVVRQAGCHVRIMPKDEEKIRIWLYLLELKRSGWGAKRIAHHLNSLGIASPDAGCLRTDQGVQHRVSGKWCAEYGPGIMSQFRDTRQTTIRASERRKISSDCEDRTSSPGR